MPQLPIPDQMTAVVLDAYTGHTALRVERRPVPAPGANEVLVKVDASPINPSDIAFLEGWYGFKKPVPIIPGFEGSGTVVASGQGLMGRYLAGKRVACLAPRKGDGVWAEYMVTSVNSALPLRASVSMEQGSMAVVNPLTATAFLSIMTKGGHKAIVQTAAASALGQMVLRLAKSKDITVINVVRRQEQVTLLEGQGAQFVLNSSDKDFDKQLKELCHQHGTRLAFDAIAGSMTMRLLEAMPSGSKVTVYGGLSYEPAAANPGQLIFHDKQVDGFWLSSWTANKNLFQMLSLWRWSQKLLSTKLGSEVRARYPLEQVAQALQDYQKRMTGGKLLLVPGS